MTEPQDGARTEALDGAPHEARHEAQVGRPRHQHPAAESIAGFFTGLVAVIVVPGAYAALLSALFDQDTAEQLFPFVLVALAVPLTMLVADRTRRFARYLLLGVVSTALVVIGVAAVVLWYMTRT